MNFFRSIWRIITFPFRALFWLLRQVYLWLRSIFTSIWGLFSEDPEESSVVDAFAKAVENPSGLLEHIAELRSHLFRAVVALFFTTTLSFVFAEPILNYLARPVGGNTALESIGVTESLSVFMRVALLTGFTLALPYMILELLLFAAPGLKRSERRLGCIAIPLITLLFAGGMAFALFVALEPALGFLTNFIFNTQLRPAEYFPFVTSMLFWTGVVFEIPIVIYFITAMGFVRAEVLRDQARFVLVGLAVLAAAITPTTDPINMLIILAPLIALYYIGVVLAFIAQRGRDRRRAAAGEAG